MSNNVPGTVLSDEKAKQNISVNVQRLLAQREMSQTALADATEESPARISLMIRGIKLPSAAFLARIAEALGTTSDDLLEAPKKNSGKIPA